MGNSYHIAASGDGKTFLVTGVNGTNLHNLNGFTETQATEVAYHLNAAYFAGQNAARAAMRSAIGVVQ